MGSVRDLRACVGGEELGERGVDVVGGDLLVVDVQVFEDGLVQPPAGLVAGCRVELVRIGEQLEAEVDVLSTLSKIVEDLIQLGGDAPALLGDLA
ncbi:hypothetical protein [Gordonia polyisoprenivorans]|uniref:hypothetical protein n=1 Tax=Gordonia polyisoprenivorans TaxID=84595 RepID=UPI001AD79E96|nr:hypothetical protein [Gordonia polyisoprenivorans]QTI71395.1 hypothetical protein J6U32_13305 [Gordonia polyisoprenivorans]